MRGAERALRAALALLALPVAALAAEGEGQGEPTELPDLVVTSQKTEQTLEQVPASVSAIGGDFMRSVGATGFDKMADYTGNISISLGHTAGTFSIRGFSTPDTNPAFDPSVGAVVDGVYYGRAQFLAAFFNDVDRMEVLRGPQGTLFGKNCTAGLINVVTEEPSNKLASTAEILIDGNGQRSLRPALTVPVGNDFSMRLSGNFASDNHGELFNTFLDRVEEDTHQDSMRMKMRYAGGGPLTGDFEAFRSTDHYNNNGFQFIRLTPQMQQLVQTYDPLAKAGTSDYKNSANLPAGADAAIQGMSGTANYELGPDVSLTSITAYATSNTTRLDLDADFSPVPFIHDVLAEPKVYTQYSQELRLTGKLPALFGMGKTFSFVTGLYAARSTFRTSDIFAVEDLSAAAQYCSATSGFCGQGSPLPPSSTGTAGGNAGTLDPALIAAAQAAGQNQQFAHVWLHQQQPAYAVFGQFEHFFLEHWALIGGLRYGIEGKRGDAHARHQGNLIPSLANEQDHDTYVSRREHDLSPKAGLKWEPAKDTDVYATWSRGYKSGGFNGLPLNPNNLEYEPEQATSIELGAKSKAEFLGGPIRASAAIFNTDFDNLQVSTFTGGSFVVLNAAAARSRGAEMDLHWLPPLTGVSMLSSLGYADARYKSYPNAPAIADSGQQSQDLSGRPLSLAPRWTASLVPGYQFPLTEQLGANFAVDMLYRSERYLDVDDDARKLQPDTTQYNARVSLAPYSSTWLVTLGAHNLTNRVIFDQVINQPLAPGNFTGFRTDRARYYSMNLTATF